MANEDSALREVDQELAEERQWAMFRRYGPALMGASAALIIGVGAWQLFDASRTRSANEEAVQFAEASELLIQDEAAGRDALAAIAQDGGSGYAALAQFRRAASFAAAGDRQAAIDVFVEIYGDNSVPQSMKSLARIRAGYLSLQDGRDAALGHLGPLTERNDAYKPYADEITGLAALKAEDYETALSVFTALSSAPGASPQLSLRAEEFLALAVAGKAGVNLAGRFAVDDILGAVDAASGEAGGAVDAHAGHDHAADEHGSDDAATPENETEPQETADPAANDTEAGDADEPATDDPAESGNE